MSKLIWDETGKRLFESGVSFGTLYKYDDTKKEYGVGVAWNGLTKVGENPSGAEPTPLYANNKKYLNLQSAEEFGATIEAYTYPDEFAECNGEYELVQGVTVAQQKRKMFGLAYRTELGSDTNSTMGYKLHLVYGAQAAPSGKEYATLNENPEAITLAWEISTTPVVVPGMDKPTATLVINSTHVEKEKLKKLEDKLFGTDNSDPTLLLPEEVAELLKTA